MESTVKLKNTNIIKFWSDFTQMISIINGPHVHFMWHCSTLANKLDEEDENRNFLSHPKFIKSIIDYFENPATFLNETDILHFHYRFRIFSVQ